MTSSAHNSHSSTLGTSADELVQPSDPENKKAEVALQTKLFLKYLEKKGLVNALKMAEKGINMDEIHKESNMESFAGLSAAEGADEFLDSLMTNYGFDPRHHNSAMFLKACDDNNMDHAIQLASNGVFLGKKDSEGGSIFDKIVGLTRSYLDKKYQNKEGKNTAKIATLIRTLVRCGLDIKKLNSAIFFQYLEEGNIDYAIKTVKSGDGIDFKECNTFNEFIADRNTPLIRAVRLNHPDVVKALLTNGADPNYYDQKNDNNPAIVYCIFDTEQRYEKTGGDSEVAILGHLINHKVDIEQTELKSNPLQYALDHCHVHLAKTLINNGAIISDRDQFGDNFLHKIARDGTDTLFELLKLGRVADSVARSDLINAKNEDGDSPLLIAAGTGNIALMKFLIDNGAAIESDNTYGLTPALESFRTKNMKSYEYLLGKGAKKVDLTEICRNKFADLLGEHSSNEEIEDLISRFIHFKKRDDSEFDGPDLVTLIFDVDFANSSEEFKKFTNDVIASLNSEKALLEEISKEELLKEEQQKQLAEKAIAKRLDKAQLNLKKDEEDLKALQLKSKELEARSLHSYNIAKKQAEERRVAEAEEAAHLAEALERQQRTQSAAKTAEELAARDPVAELRATQAKLGAFKQALFESRSSNQQLAATLFESRSSNQQLAATLFESRSSNQQLYTDNRQLHITNHHLAARIQHHAALMGVDSSLRQRDYELRKENNALREGIGVEEVTVQELVRGNRALRRENTSLRQKLGSQARKTQESNDLIQRHIKIAKRESPENFPLTPSSSSDSSYKSSGGSSDGSPLVARKGAKSITPPLATPPLAAEEEKFEFSDIRAAIESRDNEALLGVIYEKTPTIGEMLEGLDHDDLSTLLTGSEEANPLTITFHGSRISRPLLKRKINPNSDLDMQLRFDDLNFAEDPASLERLHNALIFFLKNKLDVQYVIPEKAVPFAVGGIVTNINFSFTPTKAGSGPDIDIVLCSQHYKYDSPTSVNDCKIIKEPGKDPAVEGASGLLRPTINFNYIFEGISGYNYNKAVTSIARSIISLHKSGKDPKKIVSVFSKDRNYDSLKDYILEAPNLDERKIRIIKVQNHLLPKGVESIQGRILEIKPELMDKPELKNELDEAVVAVANSLRVSITRATNDLGIEYAPRKQYIPTPKRVLAITDPNRKLPPRGESAATGGGVARARPIAGRPASIPQLRPLQQAAGQPTSVETSPQHSPARVNPPPNFKTLFNSENFSLTQ